MSDPRPTPESHLGRARRLWFPLTALAFLNLACLLLGAECDSRNGLVIDPNPYRAALGLPEIHGSEYEWQGTQFGKLSTDFWSAVAEPVSATIKSGPNIVQATLTEIALNAAIDDLVTNGFLAVRVPHAPPTYTTSSLTISNVRFRYQQTEGGAVITVPITITRRITGEAQVQAKHPITDGRSHWEVWWLPQASARPTVTFPIFLDPSYDIANASVEIDFPGSDARNCAGCALEWVLFTGRDYVGPYRRDIILADGPGVPPSNPKVGWLDSFPCGTGANFLELMIPGRPVTVTHCLSNRDSVTRTFTITHGSLLGLGYQLYGRDPASATATLLSGSQVTVGVGANNGWIVEAVLTPTATLTDVIRETVSLTATSRVSPTVRASVSTSIFGERYQLQEGPVPVVTALSPTTTTAGAPGFSLVVTGSGFISGTVGLWNGAPRPTTVISSTRISVTIAASDVVTAGSVQVHARNGGTGGFLSNGRPFTIVPPNTTLSFRSFLQGVRRNHLGP